ncbi:apoptosis regulatory protein Siva-like [Pararge aegeria]|uniref:Jg9943 protein n=1 Tax=Pararge aegeria aegeria TaxID=348720 RepID=A0A8S4S522_9NEOP|nr:apoptosis regulatory protein Siva-like [Pararge aegeria]CAH2253984.1 jg9943 [Pararge aegeria aegeria]
MAKRSNPYSEDYIQQSKTHVGLKQFNNNEDRLKKVYEKTLQLLFKGAKKTLQNELLQCSDVSSTEKKDGMKFKQLFISKNGGLVHSGTLPIEKNVVTQHCACNSLAAENCTYCEIDLCAACRHQCTACQLVHCSKCSLIGSEGSEICVSCYS